jgi:hypothetical protein
MTAPQQAPGEQGAPKDFIGFLEYYLVTKAPFQIPDNGREWIVQYGPWIVIVLLVLSLPALLVVLGLGTALMPLAGVAYATGFGYLALGLVLQLGLTIASLPGLFARRMSGWNLLFYARLVGLAFSLLAGNIISALVGALISLYILFQVRPLYKA